MGRALTLLELLEVFELERARVIDSDDQAYIDYVLNGKPRANMAYKKLVEGEE